jgi:hypothetical protein
MTADAPKPRVALNVDGIPASLRKLAHWVGFRLTAPKKPGDKPGKVPVNPLTGRNASTTDPRTWGTFHDAVAAYRRGEVDGIGFVFTGSGYSGVDFDHCRDAETGVINPNVLAQVHALASYAEVSPTGTGLHVFVRGNLPGKGIKVGNVEVYDNGRFFTVTGERVPDTPAEVADRPVEIAEFYNRVNACRPGAARAPLFTVPKPTERPSDPGLDDDNMRVEETLLLDALSKNEKFRALWYGDHSAYPSQSEADLAFCNLARIYCGRNPARIDRLFRRSGLMREKWDEKHGEQTYGQMTIEKACADASSEQPKPGWFPPKPGSGIPKPGGPSKPGASPTEIIVIPGELPKNTDQAEQLLLALKPPRVFQRDRSLVQIVRTKSLSTREGTARPEGALVLAPVETDFLVELLTKQGSWRKRAKKNLVSIDAPQKIARTYLSRVGQWRVPALVAVIETPTIRADGSVLSTPGYDPQTGLYFDAGSTVFPTINPTPTREDAIAALSKFEPVLREFPWREPADRSAALSGLMTPLVRRTLRSAPLHANRAPTMSSGKSLLVDCASYLATGRVCAVMTQGKDEDEQAKRMLAVLVEGDAVNSIDNIEHPLGGADFCSILTQEMYQGRLLGLTRMVRMPTCTTWFATGNNLVIQGDLCSRVVLCDLAPPCAQPQERTFEINLHEYVPQHRGELVVAGLTMMLAYIHAGRPDVGLKPFGRFETWSDLVRATIVWLGLPDPLATLHRIEDIDPVRRQLREILHAWKYVFENQTVTAGEVVATLNPAADSIMSMLLCDATRAQPGKLSAQAVGLYLRKYERRIEDGLCFERVGESKGVARWRVIEVGGGLGGVRGDSGATRENKSETSEERNRDLGGNPPQLPQVPPGSCYLCKGTRFWRLREGSSVVCATCQPPAVAAEEVVWIGREPAATPTPSAAQTTWSGPPMPTGAAMSPEEHARRMGRVPVRTPSPGDVPPGTSGEPRISDSGPNPRSPRSGAAELRSPLESDAGEEAI